MSSYSTVCVDASLVVRYILAPDDSILGEQWESWLSNGFTLVAPSLLFYEVTNAFYQYQKSGLIQVDTIREAHETALGLPIELRSSADLHLRARILAERYCLPATYDAHYLALSEAMEIDLWTADARLVKALRPFGVSRVKLVGVSVSPF